MEPAFEECLLVPYGAEEPAAERLLVLAPHPDDEVLGCGALAALTVRAGGSAVALVLTDGAAGNFSGAEEAAAYVATRREESRRAARLLGCGEPLFLDFPDRSLGSRLPEVVSAVAAAARETGATVLVAPSPAETHPDHRAAARAAYEAFLRLPSVRRLTFYEVSAALAPNRLVAADAVEGLKEEACRAFVSQLRERPFLELMKGLSRYRTTTLPGGVAFAEAFHVVDRSDGELPTWQRLVRRVGPERPSAGRVGPRLSVVIPTFDRKESLARVLAALEEQRADVPGGLEVVVVDDGSRDGTAAFLEAWHRSHPGTVALVQANAGPARARNRGVAAATGEVVVFLGDDTVPERGFLALHDRAQRLAGDGPVAVLGYTGWDRERMKVTPFLRHLNEMGAQFGYSIIEDPDDVPFNFFYTSNVSLPRALFLGLGGFDEEFPGAAWEDVELAYRATRLDPPLRLVYRPGARTRHDHPTTVASFRRRQYGAGKNGAVFARKHPELVEWLGAREVPGLPDPRPLWLKAKDAAIRLLDPLGVRLPGRWYDEVLRWDYVLGLRDGGLR